MRYADHLSPSTESFMIGVLIVAFGAFLTRAILFARREYAGIRPVYPSAWSAAQCRSLEYFRLLVGLALIPLWASFLFFALAMRTNWQSGFFGVFFLTLLLLISNAWLLLLVPRNWQKFGAISRSFWITMTFLVVWWGLTFTAAGWMFAKASASPPLRSLSGVYAAQGLLSVAGPTG
jgi:hypothetical protein